MSAPRPPVTGVKIGPLKRWLNRFPDESTIITLSSIYDYEFPLLVVTTPDGQHHNWDSGEAEL